MNGEVVSVPKIDIRPDYWEIVQGILRKHVPEYEVWAFGSRAKWTAKEYSDLDLAIVSDHPVSLDVIAALADEFSESELPWKVDVVDWATTNESFRKIIERDRVVVQKAGGLGLQSEWRTGRLGDFVELKRGYDLPQAKRVAGQIPLVSSSGISDTHHESMVKGPGVVTGRYGTLGQVFYIEHDFWPLNTTLYVRDFKGNDPKFVRYFLQTFDFFAFSDKAAVPGVNRNHLHEALVSMPPLQIQREIANVLSSLDDRIDLLRQTNATLESIARALFKSWFIDFDPVRAKAEGREPEGMDAETAELFPDSFEDSALGEIPKMWAVSEVGRVAKCVGGGTPSTKDEKFWEPAIHHWTTPKDLSGIAAPVLLNTERKLSDAGLAKVSSGLLPAGTLLMSSRAPIGYLAISTIEVAVNQGYIAMPPGGTLPPFYLYFWCQANMNAIKQKANGSTFMEISKTAFRPIPLILPAATVVSRFTELAESLFASITEGERQALQLSQIRDTLLPRLISGKLRLPEAEAKLNEVLA